MITKQQWLILGTLMVGVFLGALDISIVSPAFTAIADSLNISSRHISWIVTGYTLAYVIAVPTMSALSDRYGRRRILLLSLGFFIVGSGVSFLSQSLWMLLVGRAIQALGGGGLFPVASTVLAEVFPEKKRGMALGFIGMMWGVAAVMGPLLGGWFTQWWGWRSLFLLSLVLAFVVIILGYKVFPKDRPVSFKPLDIRGLVLLACGLSALTYGLNNIQPQIGLMSNVSNSNVGPWLVFAVIVLALFAKVEKTAPAPALAPKLFANRSIAIASFLSFTRGMIEAGLVFLPLYAMTALGFSAGPAGTLMLVGAVVVFIFTEPAGLMVDRFGPRPVLLAGAICTCAGAFLMVFATTLVAFIGYQILLGLGFAFLSGAPIRYVVFRETNDKTKASAQGAISLFSSFGIMVGTALAGSFLATQTIGSFQHIYIMVASVAGLAFLTTLFLKNT